MTTATTAIGLAEVWIYDLLSADATLATLVGTNIYSTIAPKGATYPMVVFQALSAVDQYGMAFSRFQTNVRYVFHCADRIGSILSTCDAIAKNVDRLIHGQTAILGSSGALELGSQRSNLTVMAGVDAAGVQYRELVATYDIVIKEA